ncbi:hypothetical protein QBC47DRAFT_390793 [Echria macrotheca]|uniref:Uncharacterized protein n=1 Tax=Echria macrotheca TaxID=438768 RepID=A0AAJ0B4T5_9PEZI|nr:hypothetical protein QBC47DRAFT_390793 [Echria macrotheca]
MERKRTVHVLDTPFSTVAWPQISQEDQDAILELLCSLLAPLGAHRKAHVVPSKGRRRKQKLLSAGEEGSPAVPPAPDLAAHVDVGLAQISRELEAMSSAKVEAPPEGTSEANKVPNRPPYSVVFIARSGQSSAFHCHFPQMVAVASSSRPADQAIRLVGFSAKGCDERLSAVLGIPRVSSIALRVDAPQTKGLLEFVRARVAPVEIAWINEAQSAKYRETKIEPVQTKVGPARVKRAKVS